MEFDVNFYYVCKIIFQGGWVLLQNCHLCLDFMQETFIYINTSVTPSNEDNFRIWITTEVHPKFSISLLQISIHYTFEPPEGYAFKNIYSITKK